jgi:hypothetical protein
MITAQRAQEFGIALQGEGETDTAFRERVSGILRQQGRIIEAHEALCNRLYDNDPDGGVMQGIMGAMAGAMYEKQYSRDGVSQVGDDIAMGGIVSEQRKPDLPPEMMLLACLLAK